MRAAIAFLSLFCSMPMAVLAQSARLEKTIDLPPGVTVEVASVSPAGNLVAAICSDRVVRVWSAHSGELVRSLEEHGGLPGGVQFSVDGRLLAVSYETVKYEKGTIKVFDVGTWKVLDDLASECMFCALRFSPDGRRLASSGNSDTYVWDLATQKKVATISPPFGGSSALAFSSDGKLVATADGDAFVRVYDASTGNLHSAAQGFLLEPMAVAFAQSGKSLVAGGIDKTVSIIDPETGKVLRTLPKQPGLILSLDVSADGEHAAVVYGSAEHFFEVNHIALWDLNKGAVVADFQKSEISLPEISEDAMKAITLWLAWLSSARSGGGTMPRCLLAACACGALITPSAALAQVKASDIHEHGAAACIESPTPGKRPPSAECAILLQKKFSSLPPGPLVWRFENFPTVKAAQDAGSPASVVVEAAGKVWLLTLAAKGGHSKGGTLVAETELLPPIPPGPTYNIVVAEADLGPEANVMTHKHSGPETWYLLSGEQCLELPDRAVRARMGETMSAPAETPMKLNIVGPGKRDALFLIVHDSSKPFNTFLDWSPKGLCQK